jgi:hypothetical protein
LLKVFAGDGDDTFKQRGARSVVREWPSVYQAVWPELFPE